MSYRGITNRILGVRIQLMLSLFLLGSKLVFALDPDKALFQFTIQKWDTDDGLPDDSITAILQDRIGYLWVGTAEGLVCFNGAQFKIFNGSNTPEIKTNYITALGESSDGSLWVGTMGGGLNRLKHGKFASYTTNEGLSDMTVRSICDDHRGGVWIGTQDGKLNRLKDDKFTSYSIVENLNNKSLLALHCDSGGNVWAGTYGGGLIKLSAGNGGRSTMEHSLSNDFVAAMANGQSNDFWLVTRAGVLYWLKDGQVAQFSIKADLSNDEAHSLVVDRTGSVWLGTKSGRLHRFKDGKLAPFATKNSTFTDTIVAMCEDHEGSLWLGAYRGGLYRIKDSSFVLYTSHDGLSADNARAIYEGRDGSVWIGTDLGGLNQFKDGRFSPFALDKAFSSLTVMSLFESRDGNLWIGIRDGSLNRFKDGIFTAFTTNDCPGLDETRAICESRAGGLWIGTRHGGLHRFQDGKFTPLTLKDGGIIDEIRFLHEDGQGVLWIASDGGGLIRFEDGQFTNYTTRAGLSGDKVRAIYEDKDGFLWIGTHGGGLNRFKDGKFFSFSTHAGLLDNIILQIFEDGKENLWMSSEKGIFFVSKKELHNYAEGKIKTLNAIDFSKMEGVKIPEPNGGSMPAGCRTRDGRLWIPTKRGVIVIDPDGRKTNSVEPPVVIEEVLADRRAIELSEPAWVPPGRGDLEFHYAALSFQMPARVRFKYKLEGADPEWVDAKNRRVAYYTNLRPGHYVFRVTACNNDGLWNVKGAAFAFNLTPHFYQTYSFYLLCGSLAALIIFSIHQMRVRVHRQLLLLEQQNALERERTRIAQDMHDDLGSSLTQISLLSEIAVRTLAKPDEAETHIRKIKLTAREVFRALDEIVWATNPKNDSLDSLMSYTCKFAVEYFRPTAIRCRLDIPTILPQQRLSTEVRHNLFLAVKEALNNIVKHSGASEVGIRLIIGPNHFAICIEDNGAGFSVENVNHSRNGLRNMKQRLADIGGQFELTSRPKEGTKLIMIFNVGNRQVP